jgi:sugar lactone lactonase YvrE
VACSSESDDKLPVHEAANDDREVVVDGLTSPRGLIMDSDGNLLIAEVGGGRLLKVTPAGELQEIATKLPHALNTGPDNAYRAGPSAISLLDGETYFITGEFRGSFSSRMFVLTDEPGIEPVTDAIDPYSPLSNGGNSLLAVDRDGNVRDYIVFENFEVPDVELPIETVPTGITRGPDGALYVGILTGWPHPTGAATVWRVEDLNNDGDAMDEGEATEYVTGLTAVTDVIFGTDGTLYIAEYSLDTQTVFSSSDYSQSSAAHPGRILAWKEGELSVFVASAVSPTGLWATDSTLYISEEYAGKVTKQPIN